MKNYKDLIINNKLLKIICFYMLYSFILLLLSEPGINHGFHSKNFYILLIFIILIFFLTFAFKKFQKKINLFEAIIYPRDNYILFFLFPIALIFLNKYYFLNNLINYKNLFFDLILYSIILLAFHYILNKLWKPFFSEMLIGLWIFFVFVACTPIFSFIFNWNDLGSFKILFSILMGIKFFILIMLAYFKKYLFNLSIISSFIVFISIFVLPQNIKLPQKLKISNFELQSLPFKNVNNIYLLSYCAYVNNKVLANYNIDNLQQEDFLIDKGFVLSDVYTNSFQTVASLGQTFDFKRGNEKISVLGFNTFFRILKKNNYEINAVFHRPIFFSNNNYLPINYDKIHPPVEYKKVYPSMLGGDFKMDIDEKKKFGFLNYIENIIKSSKKERNLFYFQDGPYPSPKNGRCDYEVEVKKYAERLKRVNKKMSAIIDLILKFDKNSIIIVLGDHGPSFLNKCGLIKNIKDSYKVDRNILLDSYGAFLATKFPNNFYNYEIKSIQNITKVVLDYLSGKTRSTLNIEDTKTEVKTLKDSSNKRDLISGGVYIKNGQIFGGPNHLEKLYLNE